MHDSPPADVLWGSFVTHSFLPHRGGGGGVQFDLCAVITKFLCASPRIFLFKSILPTVFFSFLSLSTPLCFSRYLDCKIRSTIEFFSGEERRLCVILVTLWQLTLLENEIFYPSQYLTGNKFSLTFCKFSLAFLHPCKQLFVILNQMSWHVVTFCISLLVRVNLYEIWAYHLCDIEFYCCCSIFLLFQNHYHTLPYPKTKEKKI